MVLAELAEAARRLELTSCRVLVAASGGVDSTALAHALFLLREKLDLELVLGHVDHGLRGPDAQADLEAVRSLARERGLAFRAVRVEPGLLREGRSSRTRPTLQEAARRLRHDALRALAAQAAATRIAMAHTLDDQAETVILRLLRGSGPDGLGGIPERSPDGLLVRPLLGVSRQALIDFNRERGVRWREDASNRDRRFARARLRPLLRQLGAEHNPRWLEAVGRLAEAQRRDAEWIEARVRREAQRYFEDEEEGGGVRVAGKGWGELPEPLARRLARELLRRQGAGRDVTRVHLARMLDFLRSARPGRRLELPGGLVLTAGREAFRLLRAPGAAEDAGPPPSTPAGTVEPPGRC